MSRRLFAALALVGISAAASACPAPPAPEPLTPSTPLAAKSRAGATFLDVRELPNRPRLTIVGRQGDPRPAIVAAIAAEQGPQMNAALAGLLDARLEAAGVAIRVLSDGAGIRVLHPLDEGPEPFLAALAVAMAAPVSADESALDRAVAYVDALRRTPLDHEALAPLARCAARGAAVASSLTWKNDAPGLGRLETARREGLVWPRTAIAYVGPEEGGEDVAEALADVDGWPHGAASPTTWPDAEAHGAFRSTSVEPGRFALEVAVRTPSAVAASAVARRLDGTAPLVGKLGALEQPWQLTAVEATALPHGGCLSLRLTEPLAAETSGTDEAGVARASSSAARAARVLQAELALELGQPARAFEVTREIIEADTAVDVASRAAWWILSRPVERESVIATALVASADDASTKSPDDEAITTAYRDAIGNVRPPPTSPIAARQVAVEPGQGQLWILVANPCALSHEGLWDGGRAALASAAAATSAAADDVVVEPWVSGDGVGILAHGGMRAADEPAAALAERVADAAGAAFTTMHPPEARFAAAKSAALSTFGGERGLALAAFAERASPSYPGWLAPWGHPDRLASVSPIDAEARWADVVRGPTRVAVIANADDAQAQAALRRLDRWLPPSTIGDACPERGAVDPARPGTAALRGGRDAAATAVIGVAFPPGERPSAALTRTWLVDRDGPLRKRLGARARHLDVEIVEGGGRAALAILLQTSRDQMPGAHQATVEALVGLAAKPPAEAVYDTVAAARKQEALRASALPRTRLGRLWSKRSAAEPPGYTDWRAWLGRRFDASQLIVVGEALEEKTADDSGGK